MKLSILALACGLALAGQSPVDLAPVDFVKDIQPVLKKSCYGCHSGNRPTGGLRLDVRSLASRAIAPGKAADSNLVKRLAGEGSEARMPMGMPPLPADQIAKIRQWVEEGAKWPDSAAGQEHWSYLPPTKAVVPAGSNAIDYFVANRLAKEGLKPSPEASRETLLRRLNLDLIGLPPTPAEVDAFAKDTRPDAYQRVVDRLLASDHYGERWARMWLDLARYADSDGYEKDGRRTMWPYRDWVIQALNRNMPFNQFALEQIAGDMLPNATQRQKIATGFLRNSMFNAEGGVDPEENNWNIQIDRATTISTTFLGSTIGCSQCHDHKFDPFTQKQFYQMVAFFNNANYVKTGANGKGNAAPFTESQLDLPTPDQAAKLAVIQKELDAQQAKLNDASTGAVAKQTSWEHSVLDAEKTWTAVRPTSAKTNTSTVLTIADDSSVLASGPNPMEDIYSVEANLPPGEFTALRLEAIPDPSLPRSGPGRDYYGNFQINKVTVEVGGVKVGIKETAMDDSSGGGAQGPGRRYAQLWIVDVSREEAGQRLPRQMVLIPEKPIRGSRTLRFTMEQRSEAGKQGLGHFRLSVTSSGKPKRIVEVSAKLRPALNIATVAREKTQAEQLATRYHDKAEELAPLRRKIEDLQAQIRALGIPTVLIASENTEVKHPTSVIRIRGSFLNKGDEVSADIPSFLGKLPDSEKNRLGLAKWLFSRENPLTARVIVNHVWETYFGRGLVETVEDFGTQGTRPSHQDLLDYLAVDFMESGWDLKALHRTIVASATYRQSPAASKDLIEKDPANILLSRGARFRVEAEMVRDVALAASGLISGKVGGPSVMPPQPEGVWEIPYSRDTDVWTISPGEDKYRRGLYTFNRRTAPYPAMTTFDSTSREYCTARRNHTDTPLQALTTLNDPAFFEAAQAMAKRIVREGGTTPTARVTYGFLLATSRRPKGTEMDLLLSAFEKERRYFAEHLTEAKALAGSADPELAAWTMLSRGLLNLDETITRQ